LQRRRDGVRLADEYDTAQERGVLDKLQPNCKTVDTINTGGNAMQIDRRQLAFPMLVLGLLSAVPAFAGADEDAIAKKCRATFRQSPRSRPEPFKATES